MKIEPKRCAIYTRKSHDEGLEQDYNSLDAQRDAAMNYIASQRANGWQALPDSYDDGGWSGGSINRPALQRMMTDVRAGLIDIVVVYKIDRLSRSLTDFAELQTEFEKYDVSFVSVTQEINTGTSSGRMMLNILMTFAQFEREVIAERIRDKLSASKKKGKYVGGLLPLGYRGDSVNMKMVIEPEEAKIVRLIYDEYLRTSSPKAVQRLLEGKGIRGREWVSKKGLRHGGRPLSIAVIRDILQNPIYIGKLRYRGKVYDGEHEGIIPVKLWERVQSTFKANSESCHQRSGRDLKPFAGLIYCGHCNAPMFVAAVTKPNGRRYRYYICHVDEKRAHRECPLHRVPAETLEQLLLNRIAALLKTPTMLAKICGGELRNALDTRQAGEALENIATLWSAMFPVERYKLIHALIQRVLVFENEVRIVFRAEGIAGLLKEAGADFSVSSGSVDLECVLTVPCKLRRYAGQVKLHSADEQADGPRLPIQTALIQAHQGMERIISGKATTMRQIARALNMDRSFVARTLQLANLAPDIVKAIWENRQPVSLTLDKLRRGIPDSWEEQRKLFLGK